MLRVPFSNLSIGEAILSGETYDYVIRVHRKEVDDNILLFDPQNSLEADAKILQVEKKRSIIHIASVRPSTHLPPLSITLLQAVGKGSKMDSIVRDATELGVTRIIPVITERCISNELATRPKQARWMRIAVEAARQCGRGDIPEIGSPCSIQAVSQQVAEEMRLLLEPTSEISISSALSRWASSSISIAIGPEGGFSHSESALLQEAGFLACSIAPFVLRMETVCATVMGAIYTNFSKK